MNNKGLTTVELILTIAVVLVIMTTILNVTYTYSDQSSQEQKVTEVNNYKNTITKIIYDDIFDVNKDEDFSKGKVIKIEKVDNSKFKLITDTIENGNNLYYLIEVFDRNVTKNGKEIREAGIKYDGVEYIIPGSENSLVSFDHSDLKPADNSDSDIYVLDIYFFHEFLEENFKIHLVVLTP